MVCISSSSCSVTIEVEAVAGAPSLAPARRPEESLSAQRCAVPKVPDANDDESHDAFLYRARRCRGIEIALKREELQRAMEPFLGVGGLNQAELDRLGIEAGPEAGMQDEEDFASCDEVLWNVKRARAFKAKFPESLAKSQALCAAQAALDEFSVSGIGTVDASQGGNRILPMDALLLQGKRMRAFLGHASAARWVEAASPDVLPHSEDKCLCGLPQATLDELSSAPSLGIDGPEDSGLRFAAPSVSLVDCGLPLGRLSQEVLDEFCSYNGTENSHNHTVMDSEERSVCYATLMHRIKRARAFGELTAVNSTEDGHEFCQEASLLHIRRMRAFVGSREAEAFARQARRDADSDGNESSSSSEASVCEEDHLLWVRRSRAFRTAHVTSSKISCSTRKVSFASPKAVDTEAVFDFGGSVLGSPMRQRIGGA